MIITVWELCDMTRKLILRVLQSKVEQARKDGKNPFYQFSGKDIVDTLKFLGIYAGSSEDAIGLRDIMFNASIYGEDEPTLYFVLGGLKFALVHNSDTNPDGMNRELLIVPIGIKRSPGNTRDWDPLYKEPDDEIIGPALLAYSRAMEKVVGTAG